MSRPIRESTRIDHVQRVLRVLLHVQTRLDADLSLEKLARIAHLSPWHFQRVFKRIARETPDAHVRRLRLERAAVALLDGDEPLRELATRAGHAQLASFVRAFKRLFRRSPGAFRVRRPPRRTPSRPRGARVWVPETRANGQPMLAPIAATTPRGRLKRPFRCEHIFSLKAAFVRRVGSQGDEAEDYRRLAAFAARRGAVGDFMFFQFWHDDPRVTPAHLRRVDRCVAVGPRRRGERDVGVQHCFGSDFALTTRGGDRTNIHDVAAWLETAAAASGETRRPGPIVEIFLSDPRVPKAAAQALVDVAIPIERRSESKPWFWLRRRVVDAGGINGS